MIGFVLGVAVARIRVLRAAIGSLITGLQTMPSIAWFPLAILLFQLSESAIMFVVVLGAAPSIANGVIARRRLRAATAAAGRPEPRRDRAVSSTGT